MDYEKQFHSIRAKHQGENEKKYFSTGEHERKPTKTVITFERLLTFCGDFCENFYLATQFYSHIYTLWCKMIVI